MDLYLKPLFMGETQSLPFAAELDFRGLDFQGLYPFGQPVKAEGIVTAATGMVVLRGTVSYRYEAPCDRCAAPVDQAEAFPVEHVLVTSLSDEETADADELLKVDDFKLPLDELIQTDLLLQMPSRHLCAPDCKGLCPRCGKNLNEGPCGCREDHIDPRLAALKMLIDQGGADNGGTEEETFQSET